MSTWTGIRVLRYQLPGGAEFVIRKVPGGVRLTLTHKSGLKAYSHHADAAAAKAHAAQMMSSFGGVIL